MKAYFALIDSMGCKTGDEMEVKYFTFHNTGNRMKVYSPKSNGGIYLNAHLVEETRGIFEEREFSHPSDCKGRHEWGDVYIDKGKYHERKCKNCGCALNAGVIDEIEGDIK